MLIRRVDEDDWPTVRDVRLRALRESPDVFGSSLAREERFAESHWRMRLRTSTTWMALDDAGEPRGLVSLIQEPGSPEDDRHVVSLWVAPEVRRQGVGWSLLDAAVRGGAAQGAATVSLWVVDDNASAVDLYVRAGFTRTGERQVLPRNPDQTEERYVRHTDPGGLTPH
ncbi:GNAT family N-acetyltransferase [Cellulomonas xiejunii]|uniref:GNAT family N-acetyltransferase n=1 Tax=Cellulomonas xiejunii TaxID=2968083 RepID=A0ABY5KWR0_9CELL|nr:GNAT family N-acetyltransferase [Cellulomonas xiejunii]MCC2313041.1 GNAT family N-acetyltransferase [Cellulomonas xiejunii]MCC2323155.1 GNAT family N-acetyltransferase [Cellulomonas xiejunii]UUI73641.1 GNAT family N-acetyltransferase [Cellulomonas xiejunii]